MITMMKNLPEVILENPKESKLVKDISDLNQSLIYGKWDFKLNFLLCRKSGFLKYSNFF